MGILIADDPRPFFPLILVVVFLIVVCLVYWLIPSRSEPPGLSKAYDKSLEFINDIIPPLLRGRFQKLPEAKIEYLGDFRYHCHTLCEAVNTEGFNVYLECDCILRWDGKQWFCESVTVEG